MWPDWTAEACAIIAGGPSVNQAGLLPLRGKCRVMAINSSYRLAQWADALYACDAKFWHADESARSFPGHKLCAEAVPYETIQRVAIIRERGQFSQRMHFGTVGEIGGGYNSGFQALNLVAQWGCRRVLLIGFDATVAHGEHWHGRHEAPLTNPTPALCRAWREALDSQAPVLASRGVIVHNASSVSALQAFPRTTVEQWLIDLA